MSVTNTASLGLASLVVNSFTLWLKHLHGDRPRSVSRRHFNDHLHDSVPPLVLPKLPPQVVHKQEHHNQENDLRKLRFPIPVAVTGILTGRHVIDCTVRVDQADIYVTCLRISPDSDTLFSHLLQPCCFIT